MAERHASVLRELTELGIALARDLQAAALASADPEVKGRLSADFHRVGRTVRQSMALEARLLRDAARFAREAEAGAEEARKQAVKAKSARVRAAVARLVWTEAEDPDDEDGEVGLVLDRLDRQLELAEVEDDFLDQPIEVLIERIRRELGLLDPEDRQPVIARWHAAHPDADTS
ncbi:hypothetical protein [Phenylobacterium sp.]|uniref:hypothetical protein n=1 Tax=Phenylobacterium sp. TaxID=1871053 RepID=UPI0026348E7A|nr:hypothetical protein [Phenylobacterium sp.]